MISLLYFLLAFGFFYQKSLLNYPLGVGDVIFGALPNFLTSNRIWNPYIVSGLPYLSNILNQPFYPLNRIFFGISQNIFTYNLYILTHYALAGYFTYIFLKSLKLKRLAAFLGGLIFMFSGFMIGHKSHAPIVTTAVWLPFVLYCIVKYKQGRKIIFIILGALGFCFSILSGYPQITLYLSVVAFAYLLFRGVDNGFDVRFIGACIFMLLVGIFLSSVQLFPLFELAKFTTRKSIPYGMFVSFSFDLKSLPLLIFPFFYGNPSPGFYPLSYNGPWFLAELAGYIGVMPLCLAGIGLVLLRRNKHVIFWFCVTSVGFILTLGDGTPLYRFLYQVPVFNLFRAPARNWLETNFAVAILTSFCINDLLNNKQRQPVQIKWCVLASGAILPIALVGILNGINFSRIELTSLPANSTWYNLIANLRSGSTIVYIPLVIVSISLILLFLMPKFYKSKRFWLIIAIFLYFDLYSFGHFFENDYPSKNEIYTEKNDIFRFLKSRESSMDNFRIWPVEMDPKLLYPCTNVFYGVLAINGVSPVWLKDYVELTNSMPPNGQIFKPSIFLKNNYVMSILAGKYIITKDDAIARILESVKTVRNQQKGVGVGTRLIIDKEDASKWGLSNAVFKEGRFILQNPGEKSMSCIGFPIRIQERNKNYKITFKAKGNLKDVLIAQIYTEDYSPPSNWVGIETKDVNSDKFTNIERILDSGDCPEDGYVRLFTHSRSPVEIKDIVVEEIMDNRILWNEAEDNKFYKKVYETGEGVKIYENLNYLPRIRFVKNIVPVSNFMEAVNLLRYDTGLNLKEEALVEGLPEGSFGKGEILEIRFKNERIDIRVGTDERVFLVLADTYFPGWKAYVDSKETKIYKTNAVTRGILINGKGKHDIMFKYSAKGFKIGLVISVLICTILIGWFLFIIFLKK